MYLFKLLHFNLRAMKMIRWLEHLPSGNRLRELGVLQPREEKALGGTFIAAF